MKDVYYRQCKLVKTNKEYTLTQTAWIPEKFAILDKIIKIKEDGKWIDGWKVTLVSSTRRLERYLPDSHENIKRHRKNTGVSMPKETKC